MPELEIVTVVQQSASARNGLFVFLELAFVLAFARGVAGAATTTGAIAAGVFMAAFAIGIALMWRRASQLRSCLEISDDTITLHGDAIDVVASGRRT